MNERLDALDTSFLELEDASDGAHMHIGAVMIFGVSPEGRPPLGDLRAELDRRIQFLPVYRCRLSSPHAGRLRRPKWERDPSFDIAEHVRRAALPEPGGDAELTAWCADYWSTRLDRSRPLWDAVLLEGLADGRWALATKTHHALIDGVGAVDVTQLLLDPSRARSRRRAAAPPQTPAPDGEGPALPERFADLVSGGTELLSHPARMLAEARAAASLVVREELLAAPRTSLNIPIGAHRRYALVRTRLSDAKAVKRALGGTVNDVVLAAATGGLRDLLLARGEEPPAHGLRAMVPVNARTKADRLEAGNKVSSLFVHLPVVEPDPLRRYRILSGETRELKHSDQARGGADLVALSGLVPPALHALLAGSALGARLFNLTITNVPGPQRSLYAFGSRMEEVLPLVPLAANHAIGIAVVSYAGRMFFGLSGDERSVPDLAVLRRGIEHSLAELRALGREATRPASVAAR
jgi:diacylglycerol O-acyltransferase / wax synthase